MPTRTLWNAALVSRMGPGCEMTGSPRDTGVLLERLAASLAHAVAGPLSIVTGRAELLARDADSPELAVRAQQLLEPVRQVMKILESTQSFGKSMRQAAPRATLLAELAAVGALRERAQDAGIELTIDPLPHIESLEVAEVAEGRIADIVSKLLAYYIESAARGAVRVAVTREEARVQLRPAAGLTLPSGRRELMDPWLAGPLELAAARVELALALALTQEAGGRHEQIGDDRVEVGLELHIPLRG